MAPGRSFGSPGPKTEGMMLRDTGFNPLFMHNVSNLLHNSMTFEAELMLSATSHQAKRKFDERWGTPTALLEQLQNASPEKMAEVQSKLPRSLYNKLKKTIHDDKKNKENHIAYVCWSLMTNNVMKLDIDRLKSALEYLVKKQYSQSLIDAIQVLIEFRELYIIGNYSRNINDAFKQRAKALVQKINSTSIYFNFSKANFGPLLFRGGMPADALAGIKLQRVDIQPAYVATYRAVNLTNKNLANMDIQGARLECVHFNGSDLQNANLSYATFTSASFENANLVDANLTGASIMMGRVEKMDIGIKIYMTCFLAISVLGLIALPIFIDLDELKNRFTNTKYFDKIDDSAKLKEKLDMFATVKTTFKKQFKESIRLDIIRVIRRDYDAGTMTAKDAQRFLQEAQNHPFFATHRHAISKMESPAARFFKQEDVLKSYKWTKSQEVLAKAGEDILQSDQNKVAVINANPS